MPQDDPFEKVYPDTAQGAIAALDAMSTLELADATAQPDQWVQGVWKVSPTLQSEFTAEPPRSHSQRDARRPGEADT